MRCCLWQGSVNVGLGALGEAETHWDSAPFAVLKKSWGSLGAAARILLVPMSWRRWGEVADDWGSHSLWLSHPSLRLRGPWTDGEALERLWPSFPAEGGGELGGKEGEGKTWMELILVVGFRETDGGGFETKIERWGHMGGRGRRGQREMKWVWKGLIRKGSKRDIEEEQEEKSGKRTCPWPWVASLSPSFQVLPFQHGQRFGLLLGSMQNSVWLY